MISLYEYELPSKYLGIRRGLLLQNGEGWGEIAPLPGFSQETLEEVKAHLLSRPLDEVTLPSVRFALFCASRPFSLAPLQVPLCALQTPRPDCTHLKLKLGDLSLSEALRLIQSYKAHYRLRLDFNQKWTLPQAIELTRHISPEEIDYLEEPVLSSELASFFSLTRFPVAADESLRSSFPLPPLKAAIVKPTLLGSVPSLPYPIILSSSHESSVGILQIARLASSPLPQGLDTFLDDGLLNPPLKVENGCLTWCPTDAYPINREKLRLLDLT